MYNTSEQTRYYDPEIGRFISPDSTKYLDPESIHGLNLYAYCFNNPVMYADPNGNFGIITSLIIGTIIGSTIGFGGTVAFDYLDDGQIFNGSISAQSYITNVLVGGLIGGAIGAFAGGAGSALANAFTNFMSSSYSFAIPNLVRGGALVVGQITGAQIAAGIAGITGVVLLYERKPAAPRIHNNSKKKAYDKAFKKGGKKKPIGPETHGHGWHYHPNVPDGHPFRHWHYYFALLWGIFEESNND